MCMYIVHMYAYICTIYRMKMNAYHFLTKRKILLYLMITASTNQAFYHQSNHYHQRKKVHIYTCILLVDNGHCIIDLPIHTVRILNFMAYKFSWIINFLGFCGIPLSTKIYVPQKLIPNDCTYHTSTATKINTPRIFLPTKNTKFLPTKFNTRTVHVLTT